MLNRLFEELMDAPDLLSTDGMCAICRIRPVQNRHHIVPRSQGGTSGPIAEVCGLGNASGCHGMLHGHLLHLRFGGGAWQVLVTKEPVKYQDALDMEGWFDA